MSPARDVCKERGERQGEMTKYAKIWWGLPMWKKRLNGFLSYQFFALAALIVPVESDRAMYAALYQQFEGEPPEYKREG